MIIEFSVENLLSFKEMLTLSMVASKKESLNPENTVKVSEKLTLLKSKVLFGANASGKSNLLKAMSFFSQIVNNSVKDHLIVSATSKRQFALSTESDSKPIFFQIVFWYNEQIFRYGFEIFESKIHSEWLYGIFNDKEAYFFVREGKNITVNNKKFKGVKQFINLSQNENPIFRDNSLFLTSLSVMGNSFSEEIVKKLNLNSSFTIDEVDKNKNLSREILMGKSNKDELLNFLKVADFGIGEIKFQKNEKGEINVFTKRKKFNEKKEIVGAVERELEHWESGGTQRFFSLIPYIESTFQYAVLFIIDEFEAKLHPLLTEKIINLFHSEESNPRHAQLIFATHNSTLLNSRLFRRDQICFVEKNNEGISTLKTLIEFKDTKFDKDFSQDYLEGKFGAIPFLNLFEKPFIAEK